MARISSVTPDDPVDLPGPAVGAGEEDAAQVHHDGAEEHEGGPVVDLADDEAGTHVEAQVDGRAVGLRHVHARQRGVGAVVDDVLGAGMEEEREEDAGEHEDDEAVEGDLAEHERPVVGEDLVERLAGEAGPAEAVVEPADESRSA